MRTFRADLHVHTVLSPCAEIEMLPPLIVMEALERKIQLLAITDHNASANIAAVQQAAAGLELTILPGMEVQTREEVHVLCLFDTLEQVSSFQAYVDRHLPPLSNQPEHFGDQLVVDAQGDFLRREDRLLLNSISASIEQVCSETHRLEGIFIPAHIDRTSFGLIANLGLIPPNLNLDALEVSRHITPDQARERLHLSSTHPIIQNGDAHRLEEIAGRLSVQIDAPTVAELRQAFQNHCGRRYACLT